MTLDQFLEVLETTRDRGWYVSVEGYFRCFVEDGFISEGEQQVDWPVSAVARAAGRNYQIMEWRKAGAFLGLSTRDLEALRGADQRHPDHMQLRLELEKRLGVSELVEYVAKIEGQDDAVQAAYEDNLAPWQREKGRDQQQFTDYAEKGFTKV